MLSSRPYMIRAMHEWIIDSELTPYVLVDANHTDVVIPTEFVEDSKILLNVSPGATQNLNLGNEFILFSARFNGVSMEVSFPIDAVMAIYAKENGRGMMFKEDEATSHSNADGSEQSDSKHAHAGPIGVEPVDTETSSDDDPNDKGPSGSSPAKKPSLKIVK